MPEENIENNEINKLIMLPTLKTIINEADIIPRPIKGNEQNIAATRKSGIFDKSRWISKNNLQIIK